MTDRSNSQYDEDLPDEAGEHIEKRRRDPAFQARLQRILDEERVVLERLAQ